MFTAEQRLYTAVSRIFVRFASKKQGGSTSNGRDSCPKYLGLKAGGGEVSRARRAELLRRACCTATPRGAPPRAARPRRGPA